MIFSCLVYFVYNSWTICVNYKLEELLEKFYCNIIYYWKFRV